MKINITKFTLVTLVIFISLLFSPQNAHSQAVNLSISPPLVELLIKPGKSVLVAYTVVNNGDPVVLKPNVSTFMPSGITGNISLKQDILGPVRFGLDNADVSLGKGIFLKSNENQQFLLKIRVPQNAPEGDYYYTFYVQTDPGALFTGQNISKSSATIGSNILISVSNTGQTQSKGEISSFKLDPMATLFVFGKRLSIVESSTLLPFTLIVQNSGENVIKPIGEMTLRGPLGTLSKHKVTPVNILAKSSRIIPATPSASINSDGNNSFTLKGFFIGKHTLNTTLTFGPGSAPTYASVDFIGVPIRLLLALAIGFIIAWVIAAKLRSTSKTTTES